MNNILTKLASTTADQLCQQLELEDSAKQLLAVEQTPEQYLQVLIENNQYTDAIKFLALALPKREAVWWACVCARHGVTKSTDQPVIEALTAAEAWVYQPVEENRRNAMTIAEANEFNGAGSWAAVGAFWSGGSMAPPDAPSVPASEDLCSKAVCGAVMLAVAEMDPAQMENNYKTFLAVGIDIAKGGNGDIKQ